MYRLAMNVYASNKLILSSITLSYLALSSSRGHHVDITWISRVQSASLFQPAARNCPYFPTSNMCMLGLLQCYTN